MAEEKKKPVEETGVLSEEELDKVIGALITDFGSTYEEWREVFRKGGKTLQDSFQGLDLGLQGEGVHARESMQYLRDVLNGKAKQAGELTDENLEAVAGGPYIPVFPFVKELKEKIVEESPK